MIIAAITLMSVVTLVIGSMVWSLRKNTPSTYLLWTFLAVHMLYIIMMVVIVVRIIG